MTKQVKVTISPKEHLIDPLESWFEGLAQELNQATVEAIFLATNDLSIRRNLPRPGEIEKAGVPDWSAMTPAELRELAQLLAELLLQGREATAMDLGIKAVAFGVEMARLGEGVLFQAPTQEQIQRLVSSPAFVDRQAVKFAQARAFQAITSKDQQLIAEFQRRLLENLKQRQSPMTLAREMAAEFDQDWGGWLTIARSEVSRSLNEGLFDETERLGVDYVYVPASPRTCKHCDRLIDSRVFPADAIRGQSNVGRAQKDWVAAVPLHPNCLHFVTPASDWLIAQAQAKAGGRIPEEGVQIDYVPPSKR